MMNGFAEHAIVKNTFDEASAILGQDLWAMINGSDAEIIGQTVNTQPIMLAVSVAVYRAYLEVGGKTPAAVAGHSLGEYTALVARKRIGFCRCRQTRPPARRTDAVRRTARRRRNGAHFGFGR